MKEKLYEYSDAHHIYSMSSDVMKGGSQGAVEVVMFDNGQVLLILAVVFVELRVLVLALLTTLLLVLATQSLLICSEQQSVTLFNPSSFHTRRRPAGSQACLCLRSSWSWSEVLDLRPRTRLRNCRAFISKGRVL